MRVDRAVQHNGRTTIEQWCQCLNREISTFDIDLKGLVPQGFVDIGKGGKLGDTGIDKNRVQPDIPGR